MRPRPPEGSGLRQYWRSSQQASIPHCWQIGVWMPLDNHSPGVSEGPLNGARVHRFLKFLPIRQRRKFLNGNVRLIKHCRVQFEAVENCAFRKRCNAVDKSDRDRVIRGEADTDL